MCMHVCINNNCESLTSTTWFVLQQGVSLASIVPSLPDLCSTHACVEQRSGRLGTRLVLAKAINPALSP